MKLSNRIKSLLKKEDFDLEHESKMAQSRILSAFIEVADKRNLNQSDLEKLTGLKQPFISGLFNLHRKLNMEHIALFQNALEIKLQPPKYLNEEEHYEKFYSEKEYEPAMSYFLDSNSFKNEHIIRWIHPVEYNKNVETGTYSEIKTICLSRKIHEDKKLRFHEIDESYR